MPSPAPLRRPFVVARTALAALAGLPLAATARGQFVRPDSATATSTFSALYAVSNTINGSGLPAGFGPTSAHANYTTNNHWTTATGQTIGQSATYVFAAPRSIGAFHMWAHRSNGIASNPFYTATRFDLVFRDAGGATIASFPDLRGRPGVAIAQTYALSRLDNVASVQFIVRATDNGNSSPFTGLAEVAFDGCLAADAPIVDPSTCAAGSIRLSLPSASTAGAPLGFQWRLNGTPLVDGVRPNGSVVSGATTDALVIAEPRAAEFGVFDVVVTNACSTVVSRQAEVQRCFGNCDCSTAVPALNALDFGCFLQRYGAALALTPAAQVNSYANCDGSTSIPALNALDFGCFLQRYQQGCAQ